MILLLLLLAASSAEDLPRGTTVDRVSCDDGRHSYALYLPSNYSPDREWPVLYCLDPMARGKVAVERFARAAEAEGWIVAGSNQSRNGPIEPARLAIDAMWKDTRRRFHIDERRIYGAGFSGGSRLALRWGLSGGLTGVIAVGAGTGALEPPRTVPFALFAIAGIDDFNYHEMHTESVALARAGVPHRFDSFDGGHEWLPPEKALDALRFFAGKLPPMPAREDPRGAETIPPDDVVAGPHRAGRTGGQGRDCRPASPG